MAEPRNSISLHTLVIRGLLFLGLVLLTFIFVEGLSSTLVVGSRVVRSGRQGLQYYLARAENRHAQYDRTLGWVSMPHRFVPDLYGEGRYLRTDSHGFRSDEEITVAVPEGQARAVCTGDSFAFGQGVGNDRTWCHLLSVLEPGLQTVNMGQRGYGVDQAYLWYRRDGTPLEQSLLLFSFIGSDFDRMKRRAHHGYGKPILRTDNGELEVGNTPVPEFRGTYHWFSRLVRAVAQLRSVELGRRLLSRSSLARSVTSSRSTKSIAEKMIHDLAQECQDRDVLLVLIWLPVKSEIDSENVGWRIWVQEVAKSQGIVFVDLSTPLRKLPPVEARGFFIAPNDTDYVDSAGHYNEKGNAWVATELHERLVELTEVQALLSSRIDPSASASIE